MFTGCGTALVTPFRQDLSLDEATLRALVRRQIEAGINFLVPCGTTGESPTLTRAEHLRVVEITLEEAKGKVPVLAGAGGYNTHEVIELAHEIEALGADGILSVTPYYNKPTQEGLYQHYRAIAAATRLPIVVYSVQGRTGVNVEPATLARLAKIDNIVGVKEASGNIGQMATVLHEVPADFIVLSGDDAITIPLVALGGRGVISVASNEIPAEMTAIAQACLRNDFAAAREIQAQIPAPHEHQLRGVQPHSGEGRDGADGPAGARLAPADGAAQPRPTWPKSKACCEAVGLLAAERAALQAEIEKPLRPQARRLHAQHIANSSHEFLAALNAGRIRAAEPDAAGRHRLARQRLGEEGHPAGLPHGRQQSTCPWARSPFATRTPTPPNVSTPSSNIRIVPGGSQRPRRRAISARDVTCMPPMYINVGAYVDDGTMVDSHALVGSCAQVGKNCHISAASQIGGVLEPVGALPVIIEDDVLIGGNCGVYEGTIVKRRAVLGTGTILNRSTPVYDLVRNTIHRAGDDDPLVVPEGAVVIAGARAITNGPGKDWGICVYTPVIVKYRDAKTDTRIQLEDLLR